MNIFRRFDPVLISFCGLLILGLFTLADRFSPENRRSDCRITYVYDGDTVELSCKGLTRKARLLDIDTPETRDAACDAERQLGDKATLRLRALVERAENVTVYEQGQDRFGRVLVTLWLDGLDPAETLISEALAVPYTGGARGKWCARLTRGLPT